MLAIQKTTTTPQYTGFEPAVLPRQSPFQAYAAASNPLASNIFNTTDYASALPSASWNDIAYGGSVFCAIANTATITSPTGESWSGGAFPSGLSAVALAWNGTVFCAVGYGTANAFTSTNGINWTTRTLPSVSNWIDIAWNGSVFCAISYGSSVTATSPDGITWSLGNLSTATTWVKIAWNGSVFCIVGDDGQARATSPDGDTWKVVIVPGLYPGAIIGMEWCGAAFLISMTGPSGVATTSYFTSPDGLNWTRRSFPSAIVGKSIAWNGEVAFVVADNSDVAFVSSDLVSWTQHAMPASRFYGATAWSGSAFCTVTNPGTASVVTTILGPMQGTQEVTSATARGVVELPSATLTAGTITARAWKWVVDNGSILLAVPLSGSAVSISTDVGVTWAEQTLPGTYTFHGVCWGAGVFCIVGTSGKALTSPDGIVWNERTMPGPRIYYSVAWSGTRFVAGAGTTFGAESTDGITWNVTTMPDAGAGVWGAIAWDGAQFAAVTNGDSIAATSPTGITWTVRTGVSVDSPRLVWNGTHFVAVPSAGTGAVGARSTDGITWEAISMPAVAGAANYGVALYDGRIFSADGNSNILYESVDNGTSWAAVQTLGGFTWSFVVRGTTLVGPRYNNTAVGRYRIALSDLPDASVTGSTASIAVEAATASETAAAIGELGVSETEAATANTAQDRTATTGAADTETATAGEVQDRTATTGAAGTEATTATEAQDRTILAPVSETETVTSGETSDGTPVSGTSVITEAASATEVQDRAAISGASTTESTTSQDTVSAVANMVAAAVEAAVSSEALSGAANVVSSISEAGSASETAVGGLVVLSATTEAISAADLMSGTFSTGAVIAEALSIVESQSATHMQGGGVLEAAVAAAVEQAQADFVASTSETGAVGDEVAGYVSVIVVANETATASEVSSEYVPSAVYAEISESLPALDVWGAYIVHFREADVIVLVTSVPNIPVLRTSTTPIARLKV